PVRHHSNERIRMGSPRCRHDFLVGRFGPAEGDVFADRPAEEERVLEHKAHLLAERLELIAPNVLSIQAHDTMTGVEKPRNKTDQGALAGSRSEERRVGRWEGCW